MTGVKPTCIVTEPAVHSVIVPAELQPTCCFVLAFLALMCANRLLAAV